jgi:hypothetical protein
MSLKDKLEIGLKPDAPYRKDNLPDFQQNDQDCEDAARPGDTPALRRARKKCVMPPIKSADSRPVKRRRVARRRVTTGR